VLFALVCMARQARVAWRAWHGTAPPQHHDVPEDGVA
jgi:hypothetical protein